MKVEPNLFAAHISRYELLEELAMRLMKQSSLLDLHSWYQSNPTMREAAEDAEAAANILLGEDGK